MKAPRLWLALRPLQLPLQALVPAPWEDALCVMEKQRVICVSTAAAQAGVTPGMDSARARLLCDCQIFLREPQQEQLLLEQLAERLYAFTPYIEIHRSTHKPEAGLLLEISRCLKLFSGVVPLCEKIFAALADLEFAYGLAHSAPAAWVLSYQEHRISGKENRELFLQRLDAVAIERLHDFPEAVEALQKTGFATLGDIRRQIHSQSLSSIQKRLGNEFAAYLSDLLGADEGCKQATLFAAPLPLYSPKEFFFDTLQLEYPVEQIDLLHQPLEILLQNLAAYMRQRQLSCQEIEWRLFDIHQNAHAITIRCDKNQTQWQLLHQLTLINLEHQVLPFAVDTVELICRQLQKHQHRNHTLNFHGAGPQSDPDQQLALLEAKLHARLGAQALFKISYEDSHIPERSQRRIGAHSKAEQTLPPCLQHNPRPSWLFETPLPIESRPEHALRWRGLLQLLTTPERIQGHWWDAPCARDYYMAQREDGLRLWIYRDLALDQWFVQGVFAG